jgi:hypothetical protein
LNSKLIARYREKMKLLERGSEQAGEKAIDNMWKCDFLNGWAKLVAAVPKSQLRPVTQ